MDINEIKEIIKNRKGANLRAIWGKSLKTRKEYKDQLVEKVTSIVIRGGIDFANLGVVKEGIESGERGEVQSLPWGEWGEFPLHITHKGADYARFYPASGIDFPTKVEYYLNGELATKEAVQSMCLASEFPNRDEAPLCYTVKAENVRAIIV